MDIFLHAINDSENVINKDLGVGYPIAINLKSSVDVTNPTIILQSITGIDFNDYNYVRMPELKRSYFIKKLENIGSNIWQFSLDCDVLESYKTDILASMARLKRNIRTGDYYNASIDESVIKDVSIHTSNVSLNDVDTSIILTTVGV